MPQHSQPPHKHLPVNSAGGHCAVDNCSNRRDQGQFVGTLCLPCFAYAVGDGGHNSAMARNAQRHAALPRDRRNALKVDP